jgi:hypothetical protein
LVSSTATTASCFTISFVSVKRIFFIFTWRCHLNTQPQEGKRGFDQQAAYGFFHIMHLHFTILFLERESL